MICCLLSLVSWDVMVVFWGARVPYSCIVDPREKYKHILELCVNCDPMSDAWDKADPQWVPWVLNKFENLTTSANGVHNLIYPTWLFHQIIINLKHLYLFAMLSQVKKKTYTNLRLWNYFAGTTCQHASYEHPGPSLMMIALYDPHNLRHPWQAYWGIFCYNNTAIRDFVFYRSQIWRTDSTNQEVHQCSPVLQRPPSWHPRKSQWGSYKMMGSESRCGSASILAPCWVKRRAGDGAGEWS